MPVHHRLERILDEYIVAAGLQSGQPMFQSVNSLGTWNGSDRTSSEPLQRLGCDPEAGQSGWLSHPLGCHTWRATGMTIYLSTTAGWSTPSRWLAMSLPDRPSSTTGQRMKLR